MEKQYQQLQPEERLTIASMHLQGQACGPWPACLVVRPQP
jgi:hypothetical protein